MQAQTLANVYLALDADLEIVPVLNKIDLPAADPDRVSEEIESPSLRRFHLGRWVHIIPCSKVEATFPVHGIQLRPGLRGRAPLEVAR